MYSQEIFSAPEGMTVWPSGLRRWLQAPVREGVGSNPTAVTFSFTEVNMAARMSKVREHENTPTVGAPTHDHKVKGLALCRLS